jgi:hypothetical protein
MEEEEEEEEELVGMEDSTMLLDLSSSRLGKTLVGEEQTGGLLKVKNPGFLITLGREGGRAAAAVRKGCSRS